MPRTLLAGVLVLSLLSNGCAASGGARTADWNPSSQEPSHSNWCREHPVLVGAAAGLLVVGGILTAGYFALKAAGPGLQGG